MASSSSSSSAPLAFFAISMVLLSSVAMATDYVVGDDKGWTLDFNYTVWAQDKVFRVGDNLLFNYDSSKHDVVKVNGTEFQDCSSTSANEVFTSGKDGILLKSEGKKWYICSKGNHCSNHEMKLVINVESAAPAPAPVSSAPSLLASLSAGALIVAGAAILA
ncbi:basic blue protein-like [Vigna unguiculata]|uniref:Cupredoxin n=1 Tax=Vigna unguiculata TaxID=3917 RepID=A0A4D6M9J1_VIGUN|nr:basic blue protein-like [Vigna unguiculata]QCD97370.1 Cupredoxin [Vigna unguiculata]